MYVAVLKLKLDKARLDAGRRIWNERILPRVEELEGLESSFFAIDDDTGEALSVGFWSDQAHATGFESSGRRSEIFKPLEALLTAPATRTVYALAATDRLSFGAEDEARAAAVAEQLASH